MMCCVVAGESIEEEKESYYRCLPTKVPFLPPLLCANITSHSLTQISPQKIPSCRGRWGGGEGRLSRRGQIMPGKVAQFPSKKGGVEIHRQSIQTTITHGGHSKTWRSLRSPPDESDKRSIKKKVPHLRRFPFNKTVAAAEAAAEKKRFFRVLLRSTHTHTAASRMKLKKSPYPSSPLCSGWKDTFLYMQQEQKKRKTFYERQFPKKTGRNLIKNLQKEGYSVKWIERTLFWPAF